LQEDDGIVAGIIRIAAIFVAVAACAACSGFVPPTGLPTADPVERASPTVTTRSVSPSSDSEASPSTALSPAGPETPPPVRPLPSAPIDPAIEPVSRTEPGAGAAAALKACGIGRLPRLDQIAGMGLVPRARDVPRYARMFGTEPELRTDAPAWVIQLAGRIDYRVYWADNPVCVVIDGRSWIFAPEAYGGPNAETGEDAVNPNPSNAPDPPFRLPPLAP
jgi:hypothetical protein